MLKSTIASLVSIYLHDSTQIDEMPMNVADLIWWNKFEKTACQMVIGSGVFYFTDEWICGGEFAGRIIFLH